ncbi:MAG: MarR family transcriptional regulator [Fimbriimonadaceae bacterium]|nr:MarR family transcriptional regulator [Fimbriimonadaceae bacterium]
MADCLGQVQKEAWVAVLVSTTMLMRKIEKDLSERGCMAIELYDVLLTLEHAPNRRMRMSDLADAVILSPSGITRLVDRLESLGYVFRHTCERDRRATYAILTPEGLAAREAAWPHYREAVQRHFGRHLTDEESAVVRDILRKTIPGVHLFGVDEDCSACAAADGKEEISLPTL